MYKGSVHPKLIFPFLNDATKLKLPDHVFHLLMFLCVLLVKMRSLHQKWEGTMSAIMEGDFIVKSIQKMQEARGQPWQVQKCNIFRMCTDAYLKELTSRYIR